jgi:hypothetical protein
MKSNLNGFGQALIIIVEFALIYFASSHTCNAMCFLAVSISLEKGIASGGIDMSNGHRSSVAALIDVVSAFDCSTRSN